MAITSFNHAVFSFALVDRAEGRTFLYQRQKSPALGISMLKNFQMEIYPRTGL